MRRFESPKHLRINSVILARDRGIVKRYFQNFTNFFIEVKSAENYQQADQDTANGSEGRKLAVIHQDGLG